MEDPMKDKPWRPCDHPRPGPSWEERDPHLILDHRGVPDAED